MSIEWQGPAVVLDSRPYDEADALVTLLTQAHGTHRGLARGGASRRQAALWQRGNLVEARWIARLPEQLGSLSAELVHAGATLVLDDPLAVLVVSAACAVAAAAVPEREPHPILFGNLVGLVDGLLSDPAPVATLVRWEAALLTELGYGLDLSRCAVTGTPEDLRFVSPRTGRAVSAAAAGNWLHRLLPMPPFLLNGGPGTPNQWHDGLRLTGHFLDRHAFAHHGAALPPARLLLADRVAVLASS